MEEGKKDKNHTWDWDWECIVVVWCIELEEIHGWWADKHDLKAHNERER